jgi:hypothetical protein
MNIEVPHIMLELFPKKAYTGGEWILKHKEMEYLTP